MAKRRGSKPSIPKLLLWASGMLLLGALTAISLKTALDWRAEKDRPAIEIQPDGSRQDGLRPQEAGRPDSAGQQPGDTEPSAGTPAAGTILPAAVQPSIALVIDDLGQAGPDLVVRLCSLNIPMTVAVLPFLQHSAYSAQTAHSKGKEVILHMPMEPNGYPAPGRDPGPGAIMLGQPESEVRQRLSLAMKEIPHAKGMNNHMGSRITHDRATMAWILEEVKSRGWFFLDSRTEKDTVAMEVARELGTPAVERRVFLDDSLGPDEIAYQWERAIALAKQEGPIVVIGHIHPETVEFLEKAAADLPKSVAFVHVSQLAR